MSTLWILFYEFFKTGLLAVGGGLATLPFLTDLASRYPEWFLAPTLADIVAIAESTPGPIGVNAATFAGYCAGGVPGAVVATVSLVLPSFIVICVISRFLERYRSSKLVSDAFTTIRPAVTGLIAAAALTMLRFALLSAPLSEGIVAAFDWRTLLLFAVLFAGTQLPKIKKIHPIAFVVLGAVAGIAFGL